MWYVDHFTDTRGTPQVPWNILLWVQYEYYNYLKPFIMAIEPIWVIDDVTDKEKSMRRAIDYMGLLDCGSFEEAKALFGWLCSCFIMYRVIDPLSHTGKKKVIKL